MACKDITCVKTYLCEGTSNIRLPHENRQSEVFSPWVKCKFKGTGLEISVGNESSPQMKNSLGIISFEYGWSDGWEATIEILDERGGAFETFINNLVQCAGKASLALVHVEMEWGWSATSCEETHPTLKTEGPITGVGMQLEVSYTEGKIKYRISVKPIADVLYNMREDGTFGQSDKKMSLEDAIEQLCKEPPELIVEFCRREVDGIVTVGKDILKWEGFDPGGPVDYWPATSENRLAVIRKWLQPFRIEYGKGIVLSMDSKKPNTLQVWQDVQENISSPSKCSKYGTFIVNGGQCSSVLEFNPTISWIKGLAALGSGGGASVVSGKTIVNEEVRTPNRCRNTPATVGVQESLSLSPQAIEVLGENAGQETKKSSDAHNTANQLTSRSKPITAELRIIGNPTDDFTNLKTVWGKTIGIVVMNPFHILGGSGLDADCGDWMSNPRCNPVLSNKKWRIRGVNHSIQQGSYVTTLTVFLDAPGSELNPGTPLGGPGSAGYIPRNLCC